MKSIFIFIQIHSQININVIHMIKGRPRAGDVAGSGPMWGMIWKLPYDNL